MVLFVFSVSARVSAVVEKQKVTVEGSQGIVLSEGKP